MKETKRSALRNVYVFLDNTNANKCNSVLAAVACLILLGK